MKLHRMFLAATLSVGGTALAFASIAHAQNAPAGQPHQPVQMVSAQTSGTVARYIVGPAGHVRGFVLDNGSIVFAHEHGDSLAGQVAVGASVRVDGVAASTTPQVIRSTIIYDNNGNVLAASTPRAPGAGGMRQHGNPGAWRMAHAGRAAQLPQMSVSSPVQLVIPGPRGGIRGLMLADGTSVFVHGPMIRDLAIRGIHPGETVQIVGRGGAYPQGSSVIAEHITFADGTSIAAPLPAAMPTP